jgi:hypothetical protein
MVPVAVPAGIPAVTRTDPAPQATGCDCEAVRGVAVSVGWFCVPVSHEMVGVPTVSGPCAPLINVRLTQAEAEDPAEVRI